MSEQTSTSAASGRHHRIDYIEFTVDDLDTAKTFYTDVFGWSFTDYGPGYAGFSRGSGREMGGMELGKPAAAQQGAPLVVLFSSDLDASQAAIVEAGGTITTAPFDFPGGRRFHFRDPAGNPLAVWTTTS